MVEGKFEFIEGRRLFVDRGHYVAYRNAWANYLS